MTTVTVQAGWTLSLKAGDQVIVADTESNEYDVWYRVAVVSKVTRSGGVTLDERSHHGAIEFNSLGRHVKTKRNAGLELLPYTAELAETAERQLLLYGIRYCSGFGVASVETLRQIAALLAADNAKQRGLKTR